MWIAMWCGFTFSKLTLCVINQSILKSNHKSRSIDQERPVNTYRSYDWIRIMVPKNMTSQTKLWLILKPHHRIPSIMSVKISCGRNIWHVNIESKHIKLKLDGINIKLNVKKEINYLITTNTIYHLREMITNFHNNRIPLVTNGHTISSNTIDIIYDKVVFWHKNLFFLPLGSRGKRYIQGTTRLLVMTLHQTEFHLRQLCWCQIC